MKTFKRLLQITRIVLLAILAVYAAAALLLNLSDPGFKSSVGAATKAGMAGNGLARNDFTEASLARR